MLEEEKGHRASLFKVLGETLLFPLKAALQNDSE